MSYEQMRATQQGAYPNVDPSEIEDQHTLRVHGPNLAAVTGTTTLAEHILFGAKRTSRVTGAKFMSEAAVTAGTTDYWTIVVQKRPASAPGTPVTVLSAAATAAGTGDLTAWLAASLNALLTSTDADLQMVAGDVLTWKVTKTGTSGLSFPAGLLTVYVREEA